MDGVREAYEDVPYPGLPFPQSHPDRLATHARLMGMKPAPPERCRVLELGCGDGGNLVPMAAALPGSEFVGLDLAPRAVASARASASALGVGNVECMEGDLAAVDVSGLGRFDYVIAHGVYSWVPRPVADSLLALCHAVLDKQGVAYVSYNALPGGHLRALAWDAMRYHAEGHERPAERLAAAREMLAALAGGTQGDDDPYRRFSAAYAQRVARRSDAVLYHDDLEHENTPVLFTDFMAHADAHRLQYLAEADWFEMTPGRLSPAAAGLLDRADGDRIVREQYLDFLRCRVYRQTLLCRAEVRLQDEPSADAVRSLLAAAPVRATSPRAQATGRSKVEFRTPAGATLTTDHPLLKASLMVLGDAWPERLAFGHVLGRAAERAGAVPDGGGEHAVADLWLRGYAANVIHLHAYAPAHAREPGERPRASDLARRQVALGLETVTSLGHEAVELDERTRALLGLADGTRDRDALARELGTKRGLAENLDRLAALGILERVEQA
ncbi:MAG TPA: class I SAM-dependent methyltransferase [Thermoleophilaceae bacterium]